jgi:hypothetical protein
MTGSNLRAGLREFKVLVVRERAESWRVLAANEDDAWENYEDGVLEDSVEQFVEVLQVEEAA